MTEVVVEGKILEWGNSYGVRIRKADLQRSGLRPGETVSVRIERDGGRVDLSDLPTYAGGRPDVSRRHDEVLAAALAEDMEAGEAEGVGPGDIAGDIAEDEADDRGDAPGGDPTPGS